MNLFRLICSSQLWLRTEEKNFYIEENIFSLSYLAVEIKLKLFGHYSVQKQKSTGIKFRMRHFGVVLATKCNKSINDCLSQ
jgi:hypothetical protein